MKLYKYIFIIILVAFAILFLIHALFWFPAPHKFLIAQWSIEGILAFAGAAMASISTIIVFTKTIQHNNIQDLQSKKFQIKPYLMAEKSVKTFFLIKI